MKLSATQERLLVAMSNFPSVDAWLYQKRSMKALEKLGLVRQIGEGWENSFRVTPEGQKVAAQGTGKDPRGGGE